MSAAMIHIPVAEFLHLALADDESERKSAVISVLARHITAPPEPEKESLEKFIQNFPPKLREPVADKPDLSSSSEAAQAQRIKYSRKKKWTDEIVEALLKRKANGETIEKLAQECGVKPSALQTMFSTYRRKCRERAAAANPSVPAKTVCAASDNTVVASRARVLEFLNLRGHHLVESDGIIRNNCGQKLTDGALLFMANQDRKRQGLPRFVMAGAA